jgi:hypothetical protein
VKAHLARNTAQEAPPAASPGAEGVRVGLEALPVHEPASGSAEADGSRFEYTVQAGLHPRTRMYSFCIVSV